MTSRFQRIIVEMQEKEAHLRYRIEHFEREGRLEMSMNNDWLQSKVEYPFEYFTRDCGAARAKVELEELQEFQRLISESNDEVQLIFNIKLKGVGWNESDTRAKLREHEIFIRDSILALSEDMLDTVLENDLLRLSKKQRKE